MKHWLNVPVSECDNILTSPSGKFHIPSENYVYRNECWLIIGEKPILFSVLGEYSLSGNEDRKIRIYGGNSSTSPQLLEITESMKVHGDHRHPVVSITNQMLVLFTRKLHSFEKPYLGVSYSSCSVLTSASGKITSPNYPEKYDFGASYNGVCWVIRGSADNKVTLSFSDFSIKTGDFVRVYDGASTNSPRLQTVQISSETSWRW